MTSTPSGISCGSTCSASFYANGAQVTLNETPAKRLGLLRLERRVQRHRKLRPVTHERLAESM